MLHIQKCLLFFTSDLWGKVDLSVCDWNTKWNVKHFGGFQFTYFHFFFILAACSFQFCSGNSALDCA